MTWCRIREGLKKKRLKRQRKEDRDLRRKAVPRSSKAHGRAAVFSSKARRLARILSIEPEDWEGDGPESKRQDCWAPKGPQSGKRKPTADISHLQSKFSVNERAVKAERCQLQPHYPGLGSS